MHEHVQEDKIDKKFILKRWSEKYDNESKIGSMDHKDKV